MPLLDGELHDDADDKEHHVEDDQDDPVWFRGVELPEREPDEGEGQTDEQARREGQGHLGAHWENILVTLTKWEIDFWDTGWLNG